MNAPQTDDTVLNNFKTNVEALLSKHGITHAELSQRAGYQDTDSVTSILSGTTLPNMAVPVRFAEALRVPVEVLLRDPNEHLARDFQVLPLQEIDTQAARLMSAIFKAAEKTLETTPARPTMDSIIAWWKETGGNIAACDQLSPHFDLVRPADADTAIPGIEHVGALGLTATTLKSTASDRMERFLASLTEVDLQELNMHIRTVTHSGVGMISPQTRIVELPELGEPLEVSFVRLMLPVTDAFGQPYVLNYSTLLSESKPKRQEGRSLKN